MRSEMEPVFLRFECYDFEADERFQGGLKVLQESSSSRDKTKLHDMKLFFYNKFVEPIDQTSYKQWKSCPHTTLMDQGTPSGSQTDTSKKQADETCTHIEVKQLSFAEVMRLVQEGKEVPGAIKLDIKPSNQSPTPSQMERIVKPWEK